MIMIVYVPRKRTVKLIISHFLKGGVMRQFDGRFGSFAGRKIDELFIQHIVQIRQFRWAIEFKEFLKNAVGTSGQDTRFRCSSRPAVQSKKIGSSAGTKETGSVIYTLLPTILRHVLDIFRGYSGQAWM
jgi:hypothetical protein